MSLFGGDSPQSSETILSISPIRSEEGTGTDVIDEHAAQIPTRYDVNSPLPFSSDHDSDDDTERGASEEGGFLRERFLGSDSLWRNYVRDETSLATSLTDARGDDLAAHLYNVHSWKQALRSQEAFAAAGSLAAKTKWIPEDDAEGKPWYPRHGWTDWPLEPNIVPQMTEKLWKKNADTARASPWEGLQDELTAIALRHIKRQWNSRTPSRERHIPRLPSRSASRARTRSVSRTPSAPPAKFETAEDQILNIEPTYSRPVLSADEERNGFLLRPTIASVLSQFDSLLLALHHNRAGHFAHVEDEASARLRNSSLSRSRSRSTTTRFIRRQSSDMDGVLPEQELPGIDRPSKRRRLDDGQATPENVRGRARRRSRSSSASASSSVSHRSTSNDDTRVPYARDWSEVLGLAGLTGWDTLVVRKAMDRCSSLFKESMDLLPSDAAPQLPLDQEAHGRSSSQPLLEDFWYLCPHADCPHQDRGYSVSQAFRFREHLQRAHGYSQDEVTDYIDTITVPSTDRAPKIKNNPRGWIPPSPLSCPFKDCKQSDRTYTESRRLIEHLFRTHKYDPRVSSPPPELQEARSPYNTSYAGADDILIDGTHNDGFLEII
ncbi:hypothetical protein ANO11243_075040 [Dothideomycetidae sp. 11243]|nr:hypothetical protein ANO11243_075040 [fungal sp. No.11243]